MEIFDMENEIKVCPKCGVRPKIMYVCGEYLIAGSDFDCPYCGHYFSEMHSNENLMVEAWNKRASVANSQRLICPMRHDNGNCLPIGGFCTSVSDSICEAMHNAYGSGEAEALENFMLKSAERNLQIEQEKIEELTKVHDRLTGIPAYTVPVKKGKPVPHYKTICNSDEEPVATYPFGYECPFCGDTGIKNFCSNCGAKMDGGMKNG